MAGHRSLWSSLLIFNALTSALGSAVVVVVLNEKMANENPHLDGILRHTNQLDAVSNSSTDVTFVPLVSQNSSEIIPKLCEHLKTGVAAVLDMSTHAVSDLLRSFCDKMGIAYVPAIDLSHYDDVIPSENSTMAHVAPPSAEMLNVVAAIARREQQNNIAIVYDDTFDIENTPRRLLTNVPVQHLYIKMQENGQVPQINIEKLIKINMRIIFLIASRSNAQNFVLMVNTLKLTKKNFDPNIFVITKDNTVMCGRCVGTENLVLVTAKTKPEGRARFIDYMTNSNIEPRFQQDRIKVDEAFLFDLVILFRQALSRMPEYQPISFSDCHEQTTPVATNTQQSQELIRILSQTSIMGVYGPMSFDPESNAIEYNITLQITKITFVGGNLHSLTNAATWKKERGLELINVSTLISAEKRKTYRVVTVAGVPPFVYEEQVINSTRHDFKGYCIDLLDKIAENMSFDYEIYAVDTIGSMNDRGEWSGAIKELMDNNADIAVGPISVMAERENVIDFTVPYYDLVGLTILMKKPGFNYSLVKFLSVLDEKVWGCIIGAFALFSILISLFDRLSPFSYQNQRSKWSGDGVEPRIFTLKEGVWFCMMSLTPQGGGETPRALSGRLVAATWWLFGFIIIATYTANLAAFLTVSRLETPISSLDDLSKQFKVQYAPQEGSIASIYFERMAYIEDRFYEIWKNMSLDDKLGEVERAKLAVWDYPVSDKYTKLKETMKKSRYPATKEEAINRVLHENFAFISDSTTNKYQEKINCDLWEVGEEFSRKPYALAVQEGSPLRSELSNVILQLINQRYLEELKTRWWQKDQKECPKLEDESDGISIRNIGGVFLVIVIGSGMSLIVFAFECYWYRLRPGAKSPTAKPVNQNQQVKYPKPSTKQSKEVDDNNSNKKKENSGLDSNFVSILDAGFTNNAFEIVERL